MEKPAADSLADAVKLLSDGIEVALHLAYAPEVLWGEQLVRTHELGPVRDIHAWFTDPYAADFEKACRRFTSSWIDSGINALSVTSWWVTDAARRTRLRFAFGAELLLDHHAVAGYLLQNGRIIDLLAPTAASHAGRAIISALTVGSSSTVAR